MRACAKSAARRRRDKTARSVERARRARTGPRARAGGLLAAGVPAPSGRRAAICRRSFHKPGKPAENGRRGALYLTFRYTITAKAHRKIYGSPASPDGDCGGRRKAGPVPAEGTMTLNDILNLAVVCAVVLAVLGLGIYMLTGKGESMISGYGARPGGAPPPRRRACTARHRRRGRTAARR